MSTSNLKGCIFYVESLVVGLNGAGKSTTINEIIGLLTPYSGKISIDGLTLGEDIFELSWRNWLHPRNSPKNWRSENMWDGCYITVLNKLSLSNSIKMFRLLGGLVPIKLFPRDEAKDLWLSVPFVVDPSLVDEPFLGLGMAISDLFNF